MELSVYRRDFGEPEVGIIVTQLIDNRQVEGVVVLAAGKKEGYFHIEDYEERGHRQQVLNDDGVVELEDNQVRRPLLAAARPWPRAVARGPWRPLLWALLGPGRGGVYPQPRRPLPSAAAASAATASARLWAATASVFGRGCFCARPRRPLPSGATASALGRGGFAHVTCEQSVYATLRRAIRAARARRTAEGGARGACRNRLQLGQMH